MFYPNLEAKNQHLLRLANHIGTGGAELNHIREFVERTPDPEPEAWYRNWSAIADEQRALGEGELNKGHFTTAREALQRACSYYREAAFYLPFGRSEKKEVYLKSRECFHKAMPYIAHPFEQVTVPWEGRDLAAYFATPAGPGPFPAVAFMGGADATKEEIYFTGGKRLVDRGFAVLVMDGPGQGETRMIENVYATARWETIGQPVFDTLARQPKVDKDRIGLLGISMAGFYAPKMASGGAPFKCLAVWGACFDVYNDLYVPFPPIRENLEGIANVPADQAKEFYSAFTLKDAAPKIACPVLITHGEKDAMIGPDSAEKFAAALKAPKEMHILKGANHCMYNQPVKSQTIIFGWLEDQLKG